jgi:D-glycero-alpha-D-manno-heptose 1-phosphate guanylyltransferase
MIELADTTAVILAGGLGTRLRGVLPGVPKVLAAVAGRPFLNYLLGQLDSYGIREVVLCTGYLGDQIRFKIGDRYGSHLHLKYSWEEQPLGTGGAVRQALGLCISDPILVMNGDSYVDVDLIGFLKWFCERDLEAALVLSKIPDTGRYGKVEIGAGGLITGFMEKMAGDGPGWINSGVYLLRKSVLSYFPEKQFSSLEGDLFPRLVAETRLYGYLAVGKFIDIGTPESYLLAEKFFGTKV